jgi:tripartite-type tricarboxylate transporter receptor subunit TctC
MMNRYSGICCFAAAVATLAPHAFAQTAYPSKPVRIIVPFPPGGANDIVARLVGNDLAKSMGQQFVVDNRAGASGVIGADNVAKSAPDGYTLGVFSVSHLTNSLTYKKLPYDTFRDFEPIALLATQLYVLVAIAPCQDRQRVHSARQSTSQSSDVRVQWRRR